MKKIKKILDLDDFFGLENKKRRFPFLIDTTVTRWRIIARSIIAITEQTLGSALNALIRFEISHPYSKETQRRKDEFPFAVDMQETWKRLRKSMTDISLLQKLTKNQLSTGDAKA